MKEERRLASKAKKSIIEDLRDYLTSNKTLFPSQLQMSISKRIDIIYALGRKEGK